jgi:ABC-type uncharacterized transport system auxiliary subunit
MTHKLPRRAVLTASAAICGCSVLPTRPYQERREWPLEVPPPAADTAATGRHVLLLRALRAGPGLDARGLRTVQQDGSERIDNWEEWAVPPPQGVEEDLREWLLASGLFAAVGMPGGTAHPDLILEGEVLALSANPAAGTARAALNLVLLKQPGNQVLLQRSFTGTASLHGDGGPALAAAMRAALADMLGQVQNALVVFA